MAKIDPFYDRWWVIGDSRPSAGTGSVYHLIHTTTRHESISIGAFPGQKGVHPYFRLQLLQEHQEEQKRLIESFKKVNIDWTIPDTINHDSLWEFYAHIEWNHKRKRWYNG